MNNVNGERRRSVFIQRAFQGRLIAWIVALVVIATLCSAAVLYLLLGSEVGSQLHAGHLRITRAQEMLTISLVFGAVVGVVVAGVVGVFVVLYVSHRIAGPLHRFEGLCLAVGRGDLDGSARLRSGDELNALADAFEAMLQSLRARRQEQQRALDGAQAALKRLVSNQSPDPGNGTQTLGQSLDALQATLRGGAPRP